MISDLHAAIQTAGADPSVRVVVLSASPPVFSSGHDLSEILPTGQDLQKQDAIFRACADLMLAIRALPIPVVASVQGIIVVSFFVFWSLHYNLRT